MRSKAGQEAIEFILIVSVVFFASLVVIVVFGTKIASFFNNDSSVVQVAQSTPNIISASSQPRFTPDYETKVRYKTETIAGIPTKIYDDGSVSFMVDGRPFTLSSEMVELQNIVTDAVGSAGLEDLIAEISYIVKKFNLEDPKIDVWFGAGRRQMDATVCKSKGFLIKKVKCSSTVREYKGKAKVEDVLLNTVVIKIDNHLVMIQKDQNDAASDFSGLYRIEGTIDENNHFVGDVKCKSKNINGTYETDVDLTNGLVFNNGSYTQNKDSISEKKIDSGFLGFSSKRKKAGTHNTGKWEFKFQNPNFKFEL